LFVTTYPAASITNPDPRDLLSWTLGTDGINGGVLLFGWFGPGFLGPKKNSKGSTVCTATATVVVMFTTAGCTRSTRVATSAAPARTGGVGTGGADCPNADV